LQHERKDDADWYSEREYEETPDELENREVPDEVERAAKEAAEDFDRQQEIERIANEAAKEFDEYETKLKEIEDIAEAAAKEFDELQREKDVDGKESLEDGLENDLDEVREELHDEYVNDMNRQLEGASRKDCEVEAGSDDSASSEMTESTESYHDAGGGMAYAMETKGGSAEAAETETENEKQEVSEPEAQESTEQQAESEPVQEPVNEKGTNRIIRQESEVGETTTKSEIKEAPDAKTSSTSPEESEIEEETQEVSEVHSEPEPTGSKEDQYETGELSEIIEDEVEQSEASIKETPEPDGGPEDFEQDTLESYEEPESEPVTHEEGEVEEEVIEPEEHEQEITENPEVQTDAQENEVCAEDESLTEDLEDFVRRVQDILEEKMDADDDYDYVQDPLTGEMQRVPKILVEYESEEERYRRRLRNLFAELSEEEREKFKRIVRASAETEKERSAKAVERAWILIVEQAERNRDHLVSRIGKDLDVTPPGMNRTCYTIYALYFKRRLTQREIARRLRISRNQVRNALRDFNIYHRYNVERQAVKDIADDMNMTIRSLRGVFRRYGWKIQIQSNRRKLSLSELKKLHYENGLTFIQISERTGMNLETIRKAIGTKKGKDTIEEIGRLYFQEGLSFEQISKIMGISRKTIRRAFRKMKWSPRVATTTKHLDYDWIHHLYFVEGFTQREIGSILNVTAGTIQKAFLEQGWMPRDGKESQTKVNVDLKRREYQRKRRQNLKDTRVKMFGTTCYACRSEKKSAKNLHLHRKDGTEHDRYLFRSLKRLQSLKPNEWAPLCDRCHLGIHLLMKVFGYDWKRIESFLSKRRISDKSKVTLELPDDDVPSSDEFKKLGAGFKGKTRDLKNALFGETCSLCGCENEKASLILHRRSICRN